MHDEDEEAHNNEEQDDDETDEEYDESTAMADVEDENGLDLDQEEEEEDKEEMEGESRTPLKTQQTTSETVANDGGEVVQKRKRGRPKKGEERPKKIAKPRPPEPESEDGVQKPRRGRPRKGEERPKKVPTPKKTSTPKKTYKPRRFASSILILISFRLLTLSVIRKPDIPSASEERKWSLAETSLSGIPVPEIEFEE